MNRISQVRRIWYWALPSVNHRENNNNPSNNSYSFNLEMAVANLRRTLARNRLTKPVWVKIRSSHTAGLELQPSEIKDLWEIVNMDIEREQLKEYILSVPHISKYILLRGSNWEVLYTRAPWRPIAVNIGAGKTLLRSPERKAGLADIMRYTSRIKEFGLSDAIIYSYARDIRFVFALCLIMGLTVWWALAPEPLLLAPRALSAPDQPLVTNVVKDTFVSRVCSTHPEISSPCPCGEPLNSVARDLFEPCFDPLRQREGTSSNADIKGAAVLVAVFILSLAMVESVSPDGVYINLTS